MMFGGGADAAAAASEKAKADFGTLVTFIFLVEAGAYCARKFGIDWVLV
uniref:Uncharacterized protein n=1 Tax=Pristionchus pacificus TaxID=54126 RepID=A0A8R1V3U5_PRIPA